MKNIAEQIAKLHASETTVYLACTGAGAGFQNLVSQIPGASGTILECIFPYSKEALTAFLGEVPAKFASVETAEKMAVCAWRRGLALKALQGKGARGVVGIGLSAVIATNRPLKGDHRVFIAVRTETELRTVSVLFAKNAEGLSVLGRVREGELCDLLALNVLLDAASLDQIILPTLGLKSEEGRTLEGGIILSPRKTPLIYERQVRAGIVFLPDGTVAQAGTLDRDKHVLFAGSFNPLHFGHEHIAKEVEERTGKKVVYAIADNHPDKGGIETDELLNRVAQFRWVAPVAITEGLRLYIDKAKAFPGFSFIIGADTLERLLDPKYYKTSVEDMLQGLADCNIQFFVADRLSDLKTVRMIDLLETIPVQYRKMFIQLSTRLSLSSTALRAVGN